MIDLKALLQHCIEELRTLCPDVADTPIAEDTPLVGEGSVLDSLSLVQFIILVEQALREATGQDMALADEKAFAQHRSPFKTLRILESTLSERLATLTNKEVS
ncbi:MAG: hypothetical protein ACKO34_08735 [Vampirovibrionales bacterium]